MEKCTDFPNPLRKLRVRHLFRTDLATHFPSLVLLSLLKIQCGTKKSEMRRGGADAVHCYEIVETLQSQ